MRRAFVIAALIAATALPGWTAARADEWRLEPITTQGPVKTFETTEDGGRFSIGGGWFRPMVRTHTLNLVATIGGLTRQRRAGALPDGRMAEGRRTIARAWLAEPTTRYDHAVLGDAIEAASLVVEMRDGTRHTVRLADDAVFEDLEPRIVEIDGRERVLVVKSYLDRGSALAVIGERDGGFAIIAETPPIGTRHRWLNPAGVADFDGDGKTDIALVRMPHAAGILELWSFRDGALVRTLELPDVSNHAIGSRVLRMSAVADFDGDGRPDLAIPSFDRRELRLLAFAPKLRDIARIKLPAPIAGEIAVIKDDAGSPIVLTALENGAAVAIRRTAKR